MDEYVDVETVYVTKDDVAPRPKVYPTWIDWLVKMGLIYKPIGWGTELAGRDIPVLVCVTSPKAREFIPADIAEKLGIEPKEE